MEKILSAIIIWLVISASVLAYVSPGRPSGFVNDFAGVLSAQEKQQIESKLFALKNQTGFEAVTVTIPSLDGDSVENFALRLFEEWKIGDEKRDTGLLLLVAIDDRAVKIETGYGAEAMVTDLQSGNIIRSIIIPAFSEGRYGDGISDAIDAIAGIITNSPDAEQYSYPQASNPWGSEFNYNWALFLIVIVINGLARLLGKTKSWWLGGVLGAIAGTIVGISYGFFYVGIVAIIILTVLGLLLDFFVSKRPPGSGHGGFWPMIFGGGGHGGGFGGGFGGFGGGSSGGGGASGRW